MPQLHVLQIGPYPPPEGGITRNLLAIRSRLLRKGHRCSVIASSKSTASTNEEDVYHPRSAFHMLRLLGTLKFDVLHLHVGGEVSTRVLALMLAAALFGYRRSVLTLHSGGYPLTKEGRNASPNSIRGRIFRQFARLIAVNEPIAEVFRRYGADEADVRVILPFSLDVPDPTVELPEQLGVFSSSNSPFLLSIGGLERDYEPMFVIRAMQRLLHKFPKAALMIVGDGSMRAECEREIKRLGLEGHVMLAGNVSHDVALHLIERADALLRITLFDGDSISVREALFLGTPVIATENGMRPVGVKCIDIGDEEALVQAIAAVEKNPACDTDRVPDESNISQVISIYEELAARSN